MEEHQGLASNGYPQQKILYTFMTLPFINFLVFSGAIFIYLMTSSVGTSGIGPKIIPTEMIRPSVIPARNLRSIARQKRSQRSLIFLRSQNIVCWKLSRGCHFRNNGPICIFNFAFFCAPFSFNEFFFNSFFNFFVSFFIFFFYYFFFFDWQQWATILASFHTP